MDFQLMLFMGRKYCDQVVEEGMECGWKKFVVVFMVMSDCFEKVRVNCCIIGNLE